ncbi:Alpha-galactosidase 3 [Zea mays]|uniref:alpha-galactosidase n=1 Tax=Zea mays TaxID=4577 RepID=A0A1D6F7Z2_MAIZE|nr:Alpha-galactosidase 3 [Zea mays]
MPAGRWTPGRGHAGGRLSASAAPRLGGFEDSSKGQIPPKHISLVNLTVTLNIEGSKYTIETVRGGPRSYKLRMNGSEIETEIHSLRDGGLLMQLDGNSHVIYAETEAAGIGDLFFLRHENRGTLNPYMSGPGIVQMNSETMEILSNKEVIQVNQDPLGVQGRKILGQGKYGCREVWAGPLFGNRFVVALWNVTMKLLALGLDGHAAYSGRDLWKHETLSENVVGTFGAQVDVHDTKMYIFSPATIVALV